MIAKQNSWNVVIAGFWNRMIFVPDWVSKNLFDASEIQLMIVMHPKSPLLYGDKDGMINLTVESERLMILSLLASAEGMELAEKIGIKVLNYLDKTPVSAVGVNFGFEIQSPDDDLLKVFKIQDDADLGATGWSIQRWDVKRQLQKESEMLNLTLTSESNKVEIAANFHHPVASAAEAANYLNGRTNSCRESLLALLRETYNLELERS